jgi:hypothetical protein
MNELNTMPEFQERMLKIGFVSYVATPAELGKQLAKEAELYKSWVLRTNFKLE